MNNRFSIEEQLHIGNESTIFKVIDLKTSTPMVIKKMRDLRWEYSTIGRDAFFATAQRLSSLNNPHIVRVFELIEKPPTFQIAEYNNGSWQGVDSLPNSDILMEFVDGESLEAILAKGPISIEQVSQIAIQTLKALMAAHTIGVTHSGLRPSQIIISNQITADGLFVKVSDFGLLSALSEVHVPIYVPGSVSKMLPYMDYRNTRTDCFTKADDLFGLAVIMAQALLGKLPPVERGPDYRRIYILEQSIFNSVVGKVIRRALSADDQHRYSSAQMMLQDLIG